MSARPFPRRSHCVRSCSTAIRVVRRLSINSRELECIHHPESYTLALSREYSNMTCTCYRIRVLCVSQHRTACLQSVAALFPNRGLGRPFVAGFGNRHTDEVSYAAVDVPPDRVFTIDPSGTLKMGTGYV